MFVGEKPKITPVEDSQPIDELDWRQSAEVIPQTSESLMGRMGQSLQRGVSQIGEMGGGLSMAVGEAAGLEGLTQTGRSGVIESGLEQQRIPARVGSIEEVENAGDFLEYLANGILQNSPQMLASAIPGVGAEMLAARALGAGATSIAKQEAMGIAKEWVEKYGAEKAEQMVKNRLGAATSAGVYAPSAGLETGAIASQNYQATGDTSSALNAIPYGALAGGLEMLPTAGVLKREMIDIPTAGVKQTLGRQVADAGVTALQEGGTELAQTAVENFATSQVAPEKGMGSVYEYIDATILGAAAGGAMSAVGSGLGNVLRPSPIKQVRDDEAEVSAMADAIINPSALPEVQVTEEAAQDAEQLATELSQEVPPMSETPTEEDLPEDAEAQKPEDQKQKEEELFIINDKLSETESRLDEILMKGGDDADLQQQRKELIEQRKLAEAALEGYDAEDTTPTYTPASTGSNNWLTEKGRQNKAQKWQDTTLAKGIKLLGKVERAQRDEYNSITQAYRKGLEPFAQLLGSNDVQVAPTANYNAGKGKSEQAGLGSSLVDIDDDGRITLHLADPKSVIDSFGEDLQGEVDTVIPKKMEEEAIHAAYYIALRQDWKKANRKAKTSIGFRKFAQQKAAQYAQDITRASSDQTLKAIADAYGKGNVELSDEARATEFIRAIVQRTRTGQITEDLQAVALEARNSQAARNFLNTLLDAIRTVRQALVTFINPKTAPKRILDITNRINGLLDQYTPRNLESYSSGTQEEQLSTVPTEVSQEEGTGGNTEESGASTEQENQPSVEGEQDRAVQEPEATQVPVGETSKPSPQVDEQIREQNPAEEENQTQASENVEPSWKNLSFVRKQNFAGSSADWTDRQQRTEERATANVMSALDAVSESAFPEGTTGKRKVSEMGYALGAEYPGLVGKVRGLLTSFNSVQSFIGRHGYFGAMQRVNAGNFGSMPLRDRAALMGTLAHYSDYYLNEISSSRIAQAKKDEMISEFLDMRKTLNDKVATFGGEIGGAMRVLRALKEFFFGGDDAAYSYEKTVFSGAVNVESALNNEALSEVYNHFKQSLYQGIDKVFTGKEFLAKMSTMVRRAIASPDQLYKDIKTSVSKTKKGAKNAASGPVARAAADIFTPEGKRNVENVARKIASDLKLQAPQEINTEKAYVSALGRFARDFLKDKFPKGEQPANKNTAILKEILRSEDRKNTFVDMLAKEIRKGYKGKNAQAAFDSDFEGVFDQMKEAGWSEQIRNRAVDETIKNLQTNVVQMVQNNWGKSKEQLFKVFKENIGGVASDAVINKLINEIDVNLDEQAEVHLERTFGIARNEDGSFDLSKSGNLKAGENVRAILKELSTSLRELTKTNYALKSPDIDGLAKTYIDRLGLPSEMARAIQSTFSKDIKDAVDWQRNKGLNQKLEAITKALKDQKKAPDTKSVIDKLVEMANQGYLDNPTIYEAIRQSYKNAKLPKFDPTIAQKVRELGNLAESMPEGDLRNEYRTMIANEIANAGGVTFGEKATAYYYWSLLSGPTTSLVINPLGNFANLIFNTIVWIQENPSRGSKIISTLFSNISGKNDQAKKEFYYTLTTGYAPSQIQAKYSGTAAKKKTEYAQYPIERVQKKDQTGPLGWGNWFYHFATGVKVGDVEISGRMLGRFLSATDAYFRAIGTNVALASQGLDTNAVYEDAYTQAKAEFAAGDMDPGKNDIRVQRRANEIALDMLANKSDDYAYRVNVAQKRGLETAFTQEPQGVIGAGARMLGDLTNKVTPLKIIFPFTNIVANVWNEALNYTPAGTWRWYFGDKGPIGMDWGLEDAQGNKVKDNTLLIKSLMGAVLWGTLNALSGDDEDKDRLVIYGNGPSNPEDRKAWYERGGKPYSMKVFGTWITYNYFGPMGSMLALLGTQSDLRRQSANKPVSFEDTIAGGIAAVANNQMSQSFISSFSGFMEALYSNSPADSVKRWAAFQTSAVIPNLVKQTGRWIDPQIGQSSSFAASIVKDVPVVKWLAGNKPALNVFGDEVIRREIPVIGKIVGFDGGDQTLRDIYDLQLRMPGYDFSINGTTMSDEQRYEYVKNAGPRMRAAVDAAIPTLKSLVEQGKKDRAQDLLYDITTKIKRDTRKRMFQPQANSITGL